MTTQPLYDLRDLTQEQMQMISIALEVYSRLSSGQIKVAVDQIPNVKRIMYTKRSNEDHDEFDKHLLFAGMIMAQSGLHGSYGIFHPENSDDARVAYHFHRAIEHQLYNDSSDKQQWVTASYPADIVKGLEVKIEKHE
jgi:hypothetical protein